MRLIGPVVATATFLFAQPASGDMYAPLTVSQQKFELFGTSFCYRSSCDVKLPEPARSAAPPRIEHPPRITIFGVSFCSRSEPTGPACDVVWAPPSPAAAWRDQPEVRAADVTPPRQ